MHPNCPPQTPPQDESAPYSVFNDMAVNSKAVGEATCAFLQRSQLSGQEVPTYAEIWNVLQGLIGGGLHIITTEQMQSAKLSEASLQDLIAARQRDQEQGNEVVRAFRECPAVQSSVKQFLKRQNAANIAAATAAAPTEPTPAVETVALLQN